MIQVIVSIAEKGGVGKTTLACLITAAAARAGRRVLLIGLDIQAASAGVFLLKGAPGAQGTSADLLMGRTVVPAAGHLGVSVLAGGPGLDGAEIRAAHADELRFALSRLHGYDLAVIDVAPVLQHLHRLALDAADAVVAVSDASSTESMAGLAKVLAEIDTARSRGRHVPGRVVMVANKVTRTALARQVVGALRQAHPDVRLIEIPQTTAIATAIAARHPEDALTGHPGAEGVQALIAALGIGPGTQVDEPVPAGRGRPGRKAGTSPATPGGKVRGKQASTVPPSRSAKRG